MSWSKLAEALVHKRKLAASGTSEVKVDDDADKTWAQGKLADVMNHTNEMSTLAESGEVPYGAIKYEYSEPTKQVNVRCQALSQLSSFVRQQYPGFSAHYGRERISRTDFAHCYLVVAPTTLMSDAVTAFKQSVERDYESDKYQ